MFYGFFFLAPNSTVTLSRLMFPDSSPRYRELSSNSCNLRTQNNIHYYITVRSLVRSQKTRDLSKCDVLGMRPVAPRPLRRSCVKRFRTRTSRTYRYRLGGGTSIFYETLKLRPILYRNTVFYNFVQLRPLKFYAWGSTPVTPLQVSLVYRPRVFRNKEPVHKSQELFHRFRIRFLKS